NAVRRPDARCRGDHPAAARRALTLVVDTSVVVATLLAAARLPDDDLVAPPLLWPETRSALHEIGWRGAAPRSDVDAAVRGLPDIPVGQLDDARLGPEAWRIADALGWAKTYDAEYVALASLHGC